MVRMSTMCFEDGLSALLSRGIGVNIAKVFDTFPEHLCLQGAHGGRDCLKGVKEN